MFTSKIIIKFIFLECYIRNNKVYTDDILKSTKKTAVGYPKAPYSSFYLYYTQFILFYTIIFIFLEILGITQSLFHLKALIQKIIIPLLFKLHEIGQEIKIYPFLIASQKS